MEPETVDDGDQDVGRVTGVPRPRLRMSVVDRLHQPQDALPSLVVVAVLE